MQPESFRTGVSYFGNRNPRHLVVDLEEMISHNCSFIVHTFSENDRIFYFATMAEFVELSKSVGLEVYLDPWGVGRVFGGEAFSDFALKRRHACQVSGSGELLPAACPNHPEFRSYMRGWIDDAASLGVDVVFWDEPHLFIDYQNASDMRAAGCTCDSCREKYRELYGDSFPSVESEDFLLFREDSMYDFLKMLTDYSAEKKLRNAVCLLPYQQDMLGVSDWGRIAAIETLDIIGTDPYWIFFDKELDFVYDYAQKIVHIADEFGKEAQLWIQNFKIPEGREQEVAEAIELGEQAGIKNFAAWSFYGSSYMSYIRSQNPKLVWDILGREYARLRSGVNSR